jgi:A/G-specific adenine glycosylase
MDTGLLAGLHEFPTASNLSNAKASASNVAQIPYTLLKELLMHPPHPSQSENQRLAKQMNFEPLYYVPKITHVKPAGDVVHVFSHIKKTYRVQWVLLESEGDEPPQFRSTVYPDQVARKNSNRARKPKGKQRRLEETSELSEVEVDATPKTLSAQWVPLAQVEDVKYVFSHLCISLLMMLRLSLALVLVFSRYGSS